MAPSKFLIIAQLDAERFASLRNSRFVNDYQKTFYSASLSNPTLPRQNHGTWPEDV